MEPRKALEKLSIVLVEAAMELVPKECWNHPAVVSYARKRGRPEGKLLLDRSYHHAAMKSLPKAHKRGRPDIVHFCLLNALGSVLCKLGMLEVRVHTLENMIIYVNPETRLPRIYERFKGLMEDLYDKGAISYNEKKLLEIREGSLSELVEEIEPDHVILMKEDGERLSIEELGSMLTSYRRPAVLIGAFPRGEFEDETLRLADRTVSIFREPLEAWIVTSAAICSAESALNL